MSTRIEGSSVVDMELNVKGFVTTVDKFTVREGLNHPKIEFSL